LRLSSYWLLILWVPALLLFYVIMSWVGCTPISEVDSYIHLLKEGQNIPETATCFSDNHMQKLTFHNYPELENSRLVFGTLVLSLITMWALILPSSFRLIKKLRG